MKKDLLVNLLQQIKESQEIETMQKLFSENKNSLDWIFKLTDNQVRNIIEEENEKLRLAMMYLYLKGDKLSEEYKTMIEIEIEHKNVNIAYVLELLENEKFLSCKYVMKFLETIIQAKSEFSAKSASFAACAFPLLRREDALEIVKVVASAWKGYQVEYASYVACNSDVLKREDALAFVMSVASAEEEYQVKAASKAACNSNVLKRGDASQIVFKLSRGIAIEGVVEEKDFFDPHTKEYIRNLGRNIHTALDPMYRRPIIDDDWLSEVEKENKKTLLLVLDRTFGFRDF